MNASPDLRVNGSVQYDNESREIGTNTRLRWTFLPAGDLLVVYNHNVRTAGPITGARLWAFESHLLLVKLQYALRY